MSLRKSIKARSMASSLCTLLLKSVETFYYLRCLLTLWYTIFPIISSFYLKSSIIVFFPLNVFYERVLVRRSVLLLVRILKWAVWGASVLILILCLCLDYLRYSIPLFFWYCSCMWESSACFILYIFSGLIPSVSFTILYFKGCS